MTQQDLFDPLALTGESCELCHRPETMLYSLSKFHLDRDPTNFLPDNIAYVCWSCYRHLLISMPDGIKNTDILFAFLINRGLYSHDQLTAGEDKKGVKRG